MQALRCSAILISLLLAGAHPLASAKDPGPLDELDRHASAQRLVAIGGERRLNLRCSGTGFPTVLLEAGARADSLTWRLVQPLIARTTTVCSYDRAGYGFSDGGPLPRDVEADVKDLAALVDAATLPKPLILVGHSLGTVIVRRYAERHRSDVAGLVLVDPPPQGRAGISAEWLNAEAAGSQRRDAFLKTCAKAAAEGGLANPKPELQGCIAAADPAYSDTLNAAIHANKLRPAFWQTLGSELASNVAVFATPVSPEKRLGDVPLLMLIAADTYADVTTNDRRALESLRDRTIDAIAASSTRSDRVLVANSSHDLQIDQPLAVATAVEKLIDEYRQQSRR